MKKVLFFIDSFPNYSETFLYNQIYFLLDNHYEVEIVAIKENIISNNGLHKKMFEYDLFSRVKFMKHGINGRLFFNFLYFPIFSLRLFNKIPLKKAFLYIQNFHLFSKYNSFNLIHAHYGHIGIIVCDLKSIGFFKKSKLICSFHGEELLIINKDSYPKRYSSVIKFCDSITVNSYYILNLVNECIGNLDHKVSILPECLDINFFNPNKRVHRENNMIKIIFCGRFIKWKAPILAIKIAHELIKLKKDITLDLIGDGSEYEACREYIISNKLEDRILLHGILTQEKIIEFLNNSDIFLFPGIREEFTEKAEAQGLVIQEAQAMKLPVVISDVGGMKYGMKDNSTGFVLAENDMTGFVEKIILLIEDTNLRMKMGERAREFVSKNFDISILGKQLINLYS